MARGDQLGRQWKMIQILLSSHGGRSAAEMAETIGCHPRTVYRDLEALQIAGFPIYTEREGGKSRWSLLDTVKKGLPLPMNLTELMALYFSRDMVKVLKGTVFYDALESLFQKIKTTLPPAYIAYLQTIEESLHVRLQPYKPYAEFKEILNRVNDAVVNRRLIDIVYYTMSRKAQTRRRVAPYRIWFFNGTFYMIGYCMERKAMRTFALDRIKSVAMLDSGFSRPESDEIDRFMKTSFGIFTGDPVTVKIWFSARIAGYIAERIWHETQELTPRPDGSILFKARVAGIDEVRFWVMSWGSEARVIEPELLVDAILAEAEKMVESYRTAPPRPEADPGVPA
jgi:predicted DNA-binding transcriptional regulator YafY